MYISSSQSGANNTKNGTRGSDKGNRASLGNQGTSQGFRNISQGFRNIRNRTRGSDNGSGDRNTGSSSSGQLGSSGTSQDLTGRSDDAKKACFPASARATLADGRSVRMDELQVGDVVQSGFGQLSAVFLFTHANAAIETDFLRLKTASGRSLTLTAGHFLYISGELTAAKNARVGNDLTLHDGTRSAIVSIARRREAGLFNPQTLSGDIVVNGVQTSTYTRAVAPSFAHMLLTPLRAAFQMGLRTEIFNIAHGGEHWLE